MEASSTPNVPINGSRIAPMVRPLVRFRVFGQNQVRALPLHGPLIGFMVRALQKVVQPLPSDGPPIAPMVRALLTCGSRIRYSGAPIGLAAESSLEPFQHGSPIGFDGSPIGKSGQPIARLWFALSQFWFAQWTPPVRALIFSQKKTVRTVC